jgi:hypothetical protein
VTLTIENATPYAVTVDASDAGHDGWTSVAIVGPHATTVAQDVIDEGSTWTFCFAGQGRPGGTVTPTHDKLVQVGWRLRIPGAVGRQLELEGAPPTP